MPQPLSGNKAQTGGASILRGPFGSRGCPFLSVPVRVGSRFYHLTPDTHLILSSTSCSSAAPDLRWVWSSQLIGRDSPCPSRLGPPRALCLSSGRVPPGPSSCGVERESRRGLSRVETHVGLRWEKCTAAEGIQQQKRKENRNRKEVMYTLSFSLPLSASMVSLSTHSSQLLLVTSLATGCGCYTSWVVTCACLLMWCHRLSK